MGSHHDKIGYTVRSEEVIVEERSGTLVNVGEIDVMFTFVDFIMKGSEFNQTGCVCEGAVVLPDTDGFAHNHRVYQHFVLGYTEQVHDFVCQDSVAMFHNIQVLAYHLNSKGVENVAVILLFGDCPDHGSICDAVILDRRDAGSVPFLLSRVVDV